MFNIMIVDDEPVIIKSLLSFIDWNSLDCEVTYNAENAYKAKEYLMNNHIDIIITDIRMPGMDGIEFSKYIYENYSDIKVIILTAYADFSYSQSAIKYNVIDFIIKANLIDKIPEAINKAKLSIEQNEEIKTKLVQLKETLRDKFFKDIFAGIHDDKEAINEKIKEYDIKLELYSIIVYEINNAAENIADEKMEFQNKPISSINSLIKLAMKNFSHYTFPINKNTLVTIVCFNHTETANFPQTILTTCNEILATIDCFINIELFIGISDFHRSVSDLRVAFLEAQEALSRSFFGTRKISIYDNSYDSDSSNIVYSKERKYYDEILNYIQAGDSVGTESVLKALFDSYNCERFSISQVKVSVMLLCFQCFRLLENYNLSTPPLVGNESDAYQKIQQSKSITGLFHYMQNTLNQIIDYIALNYKQSHYIIREVNSYIGENFNNNINLQTVADHIHLNSSYLSRLYKKETNISVIEALNGYRIKKSKQLLKNSEYKIFEIAEMVGIDDAGYFAYVFKKYTGMSPKDYRLSESN